MGKATADLPDPLTASEGPGNAGTDDLLAQLAGEEIDRLLAEAQVERPSDSSSETPQSTTPAAIPAARPISAPKEPASTSFSAWRTDDADMKAAESAESSILKGAPSAQSSSTLLTGTKPADAVASSTPAPDPLAEEGGAAVASIQKTALLPEFDAPRAEKEIAAVVGPLDDAALDPEIQEATRDVDAAPQAEKMGLDLALGAAAAELDAEQAAARVEAMDAEGRVPWYLLPFEWLNAAFEGIPEALLGIMGKIAILTMVNAVAVLVYVLFFRHH